MKFTQLQAWPTPEMFVNLAGRSHKRVDFARVNVMVESMLQLLPVIGPTINDTAQRANVTLDMMIAPGPLPRAVSDKARANVVMDSMLQLTPINAPAQSDKAAANVVMVSMLQLTPISTNQSDKARANVALVSMVV